MQVHRTSPQKSHLEVGLAKPSKKGGGVSQKIAQKSEPASASVSSVDSKAASASKWAPKAKVEMKNGHSSSAKPKDKMSSSQDMKAMNGAVAGKLHTSKAPAINS
jgi:hypothetical protein